jgi:hypothetical protein
MFKITAKPNRIMARSKSVFRESSHPWSNTKLCPPSLNEIREAMVVADTFHRVEDKKAYLSCIGLNFHMIEKYFDAVVKFEKDFNLDLRETPNTKHTNIPTTTTQNKFQVFLNWIYVFQFCFMVVFGDDVKVNK